MAQTQIRTPGIADGAVTVAKLDSSIVGALVPIGGIIMWSGTTIPTGWALCNGANGTPNLRNRFIVAADNISKTGTTSQVGSSPYDPGDTGGSANATLVSHSHTASSSVSDPGHNHQWGVNDEIGAGAGGNPDAADGTIYRNTTTNTTGITVATSIDPAGSSATNANLPPYYALAFIMRTS